MVDFDLNDFDRAILQEARNQSAIARTYARDFDRNEGVPTPDELPEAENAPNVRALMKAGIEQSSGPAVLDTLLYLEEMTGGVPFRKSSNDTIFLGSKLVSVLGVQDQIDRWAGKLIAIALTEPGAGSDPSAIRTTATFDDATGEWVLNGEKIFISLAHSCDAALVFARFIRGDEKGMSIFVVDKGMDGFVVGPHLRKMGQRSWDTADLSFTGCRLPEMSRLNGNMKQTLAIFNGSRPLVAAIGLACARSILDTTRERLVEAGHALDYGAGSAGLSALADRFIRIEAMYDAALLTLMHTKWVEDTQGADKIEAAITKAQAGMAARKITQECLAILGPDGVSEEDLAELWFRDARVCDIYEGPGEINRLIIARDLLGYSPSELS